MDAALIEHCADPSLSSAIVEQFLNVAGSGDPLSITVKSGGQLMLVPKPRSTMQALMTIQSYVGRASVRVGVTQFPVGVGITGSSELDAGLFEPCENLKRGTALFAKIARIVTSWYGSPTNKDLLPQLFDDAIYAWRTGTFEGTMVFQAEDPGGATFFLDGRRRNPVSVPQKRKAGDGAANDEQTTPSVMYNASSAAMRIDLSRIQGFR